MLAQEAHTEGSQPEIDYMDNGSLYGENGRSGTGSAALMSSRLASPELTAQRDAALIASRCFGTHRSMSCFRPTPRPLDVFHAQLCLSLVVQLIFTSGLDTMLI